MYGFIYLYMKTNQFLPPFSKNRYYLVMDIIQSKNNTKHFVFNKNYKTLLCRTAEQKLTSDMVTVIKLFYSMLL